MTNTVHWGFTKNTLDELDPIIWEKMLSCMSDLMEDVIDFSWTNSNTAYTILLCEMEKGTVCWTYTDCIDRIRRAHKHSAHR